MGEFWLFGNEQIGNITNKVDLDFGKRYRQYYADFFRTGEIGGMTPWRGHQTFALNYLSKDESIFEERRREFCEMFEELDLWLQH